jgi:hypothetical protein
MCPISLLYITTPTYDQWRIDTRRTVGEVNKSRNGHDLAGVGSVYFLCAWTGAVGDWTVDGKIVMYEEYKEFI